MTVKETFKLTWKLYLPVALSTVASIPCIVMSNKVSNKRYAALATAYTISEAALQEYQEKTKEIVGEKKAKQITEAHLTHLKSLLKDASKGRYGRDMATEIRDAAKHSIGSVMNRRLSKEKRMFCHIFIKNIMISKNIIKESLK